MLYFAMIISFATGAIISYGIKIKRLRGCSESLLCFNMGETLREENKRLKLEIEWYENKFSELNSFVERNSDL